MIKKYIGITLITASMAVAGCSSNDDDGILGAVDTPDVDVPDVDVPGVDGPDVDGPGVDTPTAIVVPQEFTAPEGTTLTLADTLANGIEGNTFATLVGAVGTAGLGDALAGGPLTLFAPTDAAFEALGLENIPAEPEALSDLLQFHIVGGALDAATIGANVGLSAEALNGGSLPVTQDGEAVQVAGANLVTTDIFATNGIIHVVDAVLVPPAAPEAPVDPAPVDPAPVDPAAGAGTGFVSLDGLVANGQTEYVELHTAAVLGGVYDENPWTAFIPSNDAIPDGIDTANATAIVVDHILTENGVLDAAGLLAEGELVANGGATLVFGGTPDALTVNGFAATPIAVEGATASLFLLEGLIIQP